MRFNFFSFLFLFFILSVGNTFAVVQLSGKLVDGNNNQLIGAKVIAKDHSTQQVIASTTSDFSGNYVLFVPSGLYDISVVSTTNRGEKTEIFSNQEISKTSFQNLKVNIPSNAPIPPQNNIIFYLLLAAGVIIVGTIVGFILWKKKISIKGLIFDKLRPGL
ncbi:MAG TPA: carboxypeptidase-like regulatory domain-containing protein [Patescibacteria group bacterium]